MYKIFIIEDDEIVAEIYKDKLQAEGYDVEVAHDGESGYLRLKAFEPDLLLLDMMVPRLAGVDILRMLRGSEAYKRLPIIAFSGSDELLDSARFLGATRVLSKAEFVPNQIVARITEAVTAVRRVDESEAVFLRTLAEWVPPTGRILVVDDDPIIMQLVKDVIEEEGYSVVSAENGSEAFRILQKDQKFAAGVFDVKMPSIQGTDHDQRAKHGNSIRKLLRRCHDFYAKAIYSRNAKDYVSRSYFKKSSRRETATGLN
jgi:CheY-like chemotaxis protein